MSENAAGCAEYFLRCSGCLRGKKLYGNIISESWKELHFITKAVKYRTNFTQNKFLSVRQKIELLRVLQRLMNISSQPYKTVSG